MHLCTYMAFTKIHIHTWMHTYVYICTYSIRIHTYTHTCIHTCIVTYMHTCCDMTRKQQKVSRRTNIKFVDLNFVREIRQHIFDTEGTMPNMSITWHKHVLILVSFHQVMRLWHEKSPTEVALYLFNHVFAATTVGWMGKLEQVATISGVVGWLMHICTCGLLNFAYSKSLYYYCSPEILWYFWPMHLGLEHMFGDAQP